MKCLVDNGSSETETDLTSRLLLTLKVLILNQLSRNCVNVKMKNTFVFTTAKRFHRCCLVNAQGQYHEAILLPRWQKLCKSLNQRSRNVIFKMSVNTLNFVELPVLFLL